MLKLEIKTGGAAYRDESEVDRHGDFVLDPYATEVRRNLKSIIRQLEAGHTSGTVVDINGNTSGKWKYE